MTVHYLRRQPDEPAPAERFGPRARILPRKYWSPACGRYVSRETGPLIWPLRLLHQIPRFLACIGGVGMLCGAIIIAARFV